jgi:heme/copper-type cytochrome/quinol oxidase subunit 2
MKETNTQHKPLKQTVFERIEAEHVCPRSRLYFQSRECLVWTLWLMSVVVGSLAIAVSVFVVSHNQYALYEATHENFLTFLVDILPYLWLIVFGVMVLVAVYNLRHTKRGYRYPVPYILASSVVLSFAGGSALQFFGLGYTIDSMLGERMGMYTSLEKHEERVWQAPTNGRLLGRQVFVTVRPTSTVVFADTTGQRWRLNVTELMERDRSLLSTEKRVRVLGTIVNDEVKIFHACGVFPWLMGQNVTLSQMSKEREAFLEMLYEQKRLAKERVALMEERTYATTSAEAPQKRRCAEIMVAKRMGAREEE